MNSLPEFDPYNKDHLDSYLYFLSTGNWGSTDVKERHEVPYWQTTIQERVVQALLAFVTNPDTITANDAFNESCDYTKKEWQKQADKLQKEVEMWKNRANNLW